MEHVHALLREAYAEAADASPKARFSALTAVLRRKKYWPALELKRFNRPDDALALLHNTYTRDDVQHFRELYDACRSVVLDLSVDVYDSVVVSFAQPTPLRMDSDAYERNCAPDDVCEEAFQGTVVSAYHHAGKWRFGTTSCPDIDRSRYFHPTLTHGDMLDEAFERRNWNDRFAFAEAALDPAKAYTLLLVHHQNAHLVDQAPELDGTPTYAAVFHLNTIDRYTNVATRAKEGELPLLYLRALGGPTEALQWLRSRNAYGFVAIKSDGSLVKVSSPEVTRDEAVHLGCYNAWHNILHAYLKATPDFGVRQYVERHYPELANRQVAPGVVLHRAVSSLCERLADLYGATTDWDPSTRRYAVRVEADAALEPMWRFHLAQLRGLQRAYNHHAKLAKREVTAYVRYHVTLKNIKKLLQFVADDRSEADALPRQGGDAVREVVAELRAGEEEVVVKRKGAHRPSPLP